MKSLTQTLMALTGAGIIAATGAGCATTNLLNTNYEAPTNLAENLKGLNVKTLQYNTERFHLDNTAEYVVNRVPGEFSLPDGTKYKSDAIMRMDEAIGDEIWVNHAKDPEVIFTPKPGKGYLAVVPVNFAILNGKKVLYIVNNPKDDKKERLFLPGQFNIHEENPGDDFGVQKVKTNSIEIPYTLDLPFMGNVYALRQYFPVYENSSLEKLADSEPVFIIPTNPSLTNEFIDFGTKRRGVKGPAYVLVHLPIAPKEEPKKTEIAPKAFVTEGNTTNESVYKPAPKIKEETIKSTTPPLYPPIPQGHEWITHTVKPGETLFDIAQSKNMCPEQIYNANKDVLKCKDMTPNSWGKCAPIYPGEKIKIWKNRKIRR